MKLDAVALAYQQLFESSLKPIENGQEVNVQNALFGQNDYVPFESHEDILSEAVEAHPQNAKRLVVTATDSEKSAAKGLVVPKHMWDGADKAMGMNERNVHRAKVYGAEHREPLGRGEITRLHTSVLEEHFKKSKPEQIKAETEALDRLRSAKHLSQDANTLDEGEKTDTVEHEFDEQGRSFRAAAAKGVAGHALYTSGHGADQKHHILNTCPAQTEGCGGGIDSRGIADTSRGTCFAPKAEAQYPGAAIRRACHEQAKHDPAMSADWILAHTHSLRTEAGKADKKNQRFLFRPNVVDETDTTSRIAIKHLNAQRASEKKPPIIGNSYGKTNEMHDPENNWHVTYSNTGPKVKAGGTIKENAQRDSVRVRETITATEGKGEHKLNDEGHQTPPKNSYMVTNIKRGGQMAKEFEANVTHAKYWSAGKEAHKLTEEQKAQGPEGHYDGEGKPTTPEKAHYGHTTIVGSDNVSRRYDYQKQHILHPRLVKVNDHMIPTDSRFKDNDFLPKDRFKSKTGKDAGALVITTPTESTSNDQHHSNFTHNVDAGTIAHAKANGGEYEIDRPQDQEEARGKQYVAPVTVKLTKKIPVAKKAK